MSSSSYTSDKLLQRDSLQRVIFISIFLLLRTSRRIVFARLLVIKSSEDHLLSVCEKSLNQCQNELIGNNDRGPDEPHEIGGSAKGEASAKDAKVCAVP